MLLLRGVIEMNFRVQPFPLSSADWEQAFTKSLSEREGYALNEGEFSYTQVAGMILGAPLDHYTYREFLYELAYETPNVHVLTTGLERQIDNRHFQSIQRIMNIHRDNNGLSVNRFIAFMEGEQLFPLKDVPGFYIHFRNTYMKLLKLYSDQCGGLVGPDFKRILTDTVKWSWSYIEDWVKGTDFTQKPIQIVWYGDATKSEVYFLRFLIMLGFDVLIFHSEGKDIFKGELQKFSYPSMLALEPFPEVKPTRVATVAEKATVELDQLLRVDGTFLFKPWQFRNYLTQAITLHSTYDEIRLLTREKAFVRQNFDVKQQTVYIPVIFAKVCGIPKEIKPYSQNYRTLVESDLVVSYQQFPFTKEQKGNQKYHFEHAKTNGKLDPKKIMNASWWRCRHLPEGLQIALATAMVRCIEKAPLKLEPGENREALQLYLFSQLLDIPADILKLLQQFDYSQEVPKLILFNNGKSGEMTRSDCALISLLNEFGMDIVIFNPTGQNDIELYIDTGAFDTHWLEELSFEETHQRHLNASREVFKAESVVKNMFRKLVDRG